MQLDFNPERLSKALSFRGMTISELAQKTGIARQTLSSYKSGKNLKPISEHINQIAKELNFPKKFFFEESYELNKSPMYFRSLLTTKKAYREYQKVKSEFLEIVYTFLYQYIEFPKFNLPDFTSNDPEIMANELREYWGLGNEPIYDLVSVVEENGIIVSEFSTNSDAIDAYSKKILLPDNSVTYFICYSENKTSASRIHFDIAHELGHICMHEWYNDYEMDKEDFIQHEKEANAFASAFLLPKSSFYNDATRINHSIYSYTKLKNKWYASIQAMVKRSNDLGIIDYETYSKIFVSMSKRGIRKEEPLDDVLVTAEPCMLKSAVELLMDKAVFINGTDFMDKFYEFSKLRINPNDLEKILYLPKNYLLDNKVLEFDKLALKK